jgi:hypothetical protein
MLTRRDMLQRIATGFGVIGKGDRLNSNRKAPKLKQKSNANNQSDS